jgi:hypothetical protein
MNETSQVILFGLACLAAGILQLTVWESLRDRIAHRLFSKQWIRDVDETGNHIGGYIGISFGVVLLVSGLLSLLGH